MAAITIRNISDEVVDRIKHLAEQKGISMEQEVRDLLQIRYGQHVEVLAWLRQRTEKLPIECESHVLAWKEEGRPK